MRKLKLEEIQQSTRVDDDGGRGVGGSRRRQSGHRSSDEHGRDCEAGIGVGDGAFGSRRREHPHGGDARGWSGRFDGSRRREMRVISRGKGTQGSKEGGWSRTRRGGGSGCRGHKSSGAGRQRHQWGEDPDNCDCEGEGEGAGNA
jgi:hypothetical protein